MLANTPNILQMCSFDANKSTKGASKLRRDLINAEIANLRDLLPLPSSTRQRLSQLQLMALVCVYVRKANYFQHGGLLFRKHNVPPELPMPHFGFSKALSGFLMMMTQNGKLLYISDNAAEYLGHSMEDLLIHGDSVYDIIEKQDHQVIQTELLRTPSPLSIIPDSRMFLCRMNVSRNARRQMRFGDQKVVLVQGHFVSFLPLCSRNEPVFLSTCTPVAMPETRECVVQGSTNVFTSIHSMDMKFLHIDRNGEFHLCCTKSSLQGLSWYELVHWEHLKEAQSKHRLITQSEQERSCILLLRLQTGPGKWIWVHVVLQVKDGSDSSQQPVIVCTNQVLNEKEAQVMRANSWLYQFYSLHSKMHYGLAYDTHATRLPTPYYSATMLPFHHAPLSTSSETTTPAHAHLHQHQHGHHHPPTYHPHMSQPITPQSLNGSATTSVFQHYNNPAGLQNHPLTPYGINLNHNPVSVDMTPTRWPPPGSLKRPASPDTNQENPPPKHNYNLELCKGFQPHHPPVNSLPGYGVYPSSAATGLSISSLGSMVSRSPSYFEAGGTQLLSSPVHYPTISRFRSHHKSSTSSEDEVEQSLTPTNTEDVSNLITSPSYNRNGSHNNSTCNTTYFNSSTNPRDTVFHNDHRMSRRMVSEAYHAIYRRDDYNNYSDFTSKTYHPDRPENSTIVNFKDIPRDLDGNGFSGKLYPEVSCDNKYLNRDLHSHAVTRSQNRDNYKHDISRGFNHQDGNGFSDKLYPETSCHTKHLNRDFHSLPVKRAQTSVQSSPRNFPMPETTCTASAVTLNNKDKDHRSYLGKDSPSVQEGSPYPVYEEIGKPVESNSSRPLSRSSTSNHCSSDSNHSRECHDSRNNSDSANNPRSPSN